MKEFQLEKLLFTLLPMQSFLVLNRFDQEHPLIRAYKDGKVCMANSFRSKLVHKKSGFAILTDLTYHHLFEESEIELIRKHVPWTRLVRPAITTFRGAEWDLLSLISKHREEFVLSSAVIG